MLPQSLHTQLTQGSAWAIIIIIGRRSFATHQKASHLLVTQSSNSFSIVSYPNPIKIGRKSSMMLTFRRTDYNLVVVHLLRSLTHARLDATIFIPSRCAPPSAQTRPGHASPNTGQTLACGYSCFLYHRASLVCVEDVRTY